MFENIRKCLDEYEKSLNLYNNGEFQKVKEQDEDNIEYFDMNFAKAIMKDLEHYKHDDKVAKIILASKGLSNEVKVKVE